MICPNCGIDFTPTNPRRKCCSHRCAVSWWHRSNSERFKAVKARYRASDAGKAVRARWRASEEGKATEAGYAASEKGRLNRLRSHARRRCPAPDEYIASFKRLLLEEHRPCARCGKPWKQSHQLDHIVPLALGGKDEESNYQVLCVDCHHTKNHEDLKEIWAARRRRSVVGVAGGV